MHIGYLLSGYHSASAGGGAESYVSTIAAALVERGHRVSIIALGGDSLSNRDVHVVQRTAPNLHWFLYRGLPFGKSWAMPVREIEWSRAAWSAVEALNREHPVDIVETGETLALQQLTLGKKPPLVVRAHGNPLAIKRFSGARVGMGDRLGRRLQVAGIRRAGAITAVSKFQAKELSRDLSVPEEAIHVIPNPISPELMRQALGTPRLEPTKPMILYTGRIEFSKGSLELLGSVDRVAARFDQVDYFMCGARHNSIDDQTLQRALGMNGTRKHVRMMGHVPWQPFGLPVVATNVGGLPEVVEDGVTGILVPPGDSEALAEGLIRLLSDADLRRRMGRAGQDRVRSEFTVDRIVDQTLAVYESVIRNARVSRGSN